MLATRLLPSERMEIKIDVPLAFPRDLVFATYRDNLAEIADQMPDVVGVSVRRSEEQPGEVRVIGDWRGGSEIPAFARRFVRESMLSWTDYQTWKEANLTSEWRIDVRVFPGAVTVTGTTSFVDSGAGSRIEFRGDLRCDLTKVPGVPRFLARSLNATAEKFVIGKMSNNLAAVGKAVGQILERRSRAAHLAGASAGSSPP